MKHIRNAALSERARELRRNATKQEQHLWYDFLRTYPIQFKRQFPMDRFIVDFICSKARLILEIDGSQHFTEDGLAYDQERTGILESYGYELMRISNNEIDQNFAGVCEAIDLAVQRRMKKKSKE